MRTALGYTGGLATLLAIRRLIAMIAVLLAIVIAATIAATILAVLGTLIVIESSWLVKELIRY